MAHVNKFEARFYGSEDGVRVTCTCGTTVAQSEFPDESIGLQDALAAIAEHNDEHLTRASF